MLSYQEHSCGETIEPEISGSRDYIRMTHGLLSLMLVTAYNNIMYRSPINERISRLDEPQPTSDPLKLQSIQTGLIVSHDMLWDLAVILTKNLYFLIESQFTFQAFFRQGLGHDQDVSGYSDVPDVELDSDMFDIGLTVFGLLCRMGQQPPYPEGLYTLLDFLDSYCRREPSSQNWITSLVESILTPLSMITECLVQLRAGMPELKCKDFTSKATVKAMQSFHKSIAGWDVLFDNCFKDVVLVKLGDPSGGKFAYPSEHIRTKAIVEARQEAERNSDKFWRNVDKSFKRYSGVAQQENIRQVLNEAGPLRRTTPWTRKSDGSVLHEQEQAYDYIQFSKIFHDHSKDITGSFSRLAVSSINTKNKTRGIATTIVDSTLASTSTPSKPPSKNLYHVDRNSLLVFRALFYSKNDGELPRSIRWTDVVSTLTKVGFSAEKLHGSAWQSTPPRTMAVNRGIQFHEPHSDGEVPLVLARNYGRRLTRAHGWEGSMFKLKRQS